MAQGKNALIRKLAQTEKKEVDRLAEAIGKYAEPGLEEFKSARLLADYMTDNGFTVVFPWKQIPTAFVARWGRGRPSIGIMAEYDALPDCGVKKGTWGHGCGHNLLGAGAAAGAVMAKKAFEQMKLNGTVVLWGCPAEELLDGKVYMAREGAFRENDMILGWHPDSKARVKPMGGAALDSVMFEFYGKTAHGASAHNGRSALDGVMLLDVAANYLREHVPENVRMHMCVPDGGNAPNVVPDFARAWYYVRGKDRAQVDEVRKRLIACAKGAAMATGTRVRTRRLTGLYSRLPNNKLSDMVDQNLKAFGKQKVTEEDRKLAARTVSKPEFVTHVQEPDMSRSRASSDEDNVSWLLPTMVFTVSTRCMGVTAHHRENTMHSMFPYAYRGALKAAQVFAATAVDLASSARDRRAVTVEFRKKTRGFTYDPLVPKNQRPPGVNP